MARMLKQLGCEVLSDEDGEVRGEAARFSKRLGSSLAQARYVQVGIKTQPVLFKILGMRRENSKEASPPREQYALSR